MSEDVFYCPECGAGYVECRLFEVNRELFLDLQCCMCSHEWTVVGPFDDFQRL